MRPRHAVWPGLGCLLSSLETLAAQTPPGAPTPVIVEWGVHLTGSLTDSSAVGGVIGPRLALRTPGGTRGVISLGIGVLRDSASGRGEAAIEYQLAPRAAGRIGIYFGGGLAGVVGGGRGGFLLLYVGVEQSPGLPSGWAVEAGLGGGFRLRAAYHWRRFPRGWQPQR